MNTRECVMALAAADPASGELLDRLNPEGLEADLLDDLGDEQPAPSLRSAETQRRRTAPRFVLAAGIAAFVVGVIVVIVGGDSTGPANRAYGAELVRFAESTPRLLLEGPGWRVDDVTEVGHGPYLPRGSAGSGSMVFTTGRPIPEESIRVTRDNRGRYVESGMLPAAARQRRVELTWRVGKAEFAGFEAQHPIRLPVLGTTALVNTHAGRTIIEGPAGKQVIEPGKPGDRQMAAVWSEGDHALELRAAVPDLAALEERLSWLTRVESQAWLDAMPPNVVKAADHDAVAREMLKGIPVPKTFSPSQVPSEGLTTDRYQVGAAVTATVSCLWFRQWGEARRDGNHTAELAAERAMATSRRWPILREMAKEGAYTNTIWKLAAEMPSGYREYAGHRWRLLPQAEALGCARKGIPVLPRKQKLQAERRGSLPSR